jgi:hypothetical protein
MNLLRKRWRRYKVSDTGVTDYALRRDYLVEQAVQAGKFPPERRGHWRTLYDRDPAGTETTLAALAPALVGVRTPSALLAGDSPYPRELFPELVRADRRAVVTTQVAPATAAVAHPRPAAPPPEASETELSPELVSNWSHDMFPEAAASGAVRSRVSRAND